MRRPVRHLPFPLRRLPLWGPGLGLLLALGCCTAAPRAVRAQEAGWTVSAGVPLGLRFTHDPQAAEPGLATTPVGLGAVLVSPWHVGLGLAGYRTHFESDAFPYGGRTVNYRLAELLAAMDYRNGWLALGYGLGWASFSPVTQVSQGVHQDFLASDVQEWLVLAAFRVSGSWDAALGFHLLQVKARRVTDGAPATGSLDAQLVSAGAAWHF